MMSKVRMALIGCGGMQRGHARFFGNECAETTVVAGCDVSRETVETFFAEQLPDASPAAYDDVATMLAESKPDAVCIASPHTLHFEHGMLALDAGCHVYMEKPMVTAADQAYALARRVRETDRVFVVGYNSTASPQLGYVREQIRGGALGRLELVSGYLSQGWMKATAGTWRQDPALSGGGQAYDSGAHLLNALCWCVEDDIAEVFAFVDNHDTRVDINSAMTIRFAGGACAAIAISGNCPSNGNVLHLLFEDGRIEVDGWGGTFLRVWRGQEEIDPGLGDTWRSPRENFVDAVLGRAEPLTSPRNGIMQSELMDAIYTSQRTGRPARPVRGD